MFCPKCSQKQISEDVRFCSRCGFQMQGVMFLLANDGVLPWSMESQKSSKTSFFRRVTSTLGAKVIFFSFILFILTFIVAVATDAGELLFFPFIVFLLGFFQMLYVLIFGKKNPASVDGETLKNLNPAETKRKLPPMQSVPASFYVSPNRAEEERVQPPSVTEPTTKLFKSEGETNNL